MTDALRYQRRLALAGAVITLVEIGAILGQAVSMVEGLADAQPPAQLQPLDAAARRWLWPVLAGLALAVWSRPPVLRTIGVALLVVALSGGSVLAVWGPLFVMVMAGS